MIGPNDEITSSPRSGAPILHPNSSQRVGSQLRANLLLQDVNLIEMIQSLDRERIPER